MLARVLERLNLSKSIAAHLIGKNHTSFHRKCIGLTILFLGISVPHIVLIVHFALVHYLGEGCGMYLQSVGIIPFLEFTEDKVN